MQVEFHPPGLPRSGRFMVGDKKQDKKKKFHEINGFLSLQLGLSFELGLRLRLTNTELNDLRKELKRCIESKKRLEKQYVECEKELHKKTEEVEILKVENQDLKQIIKLKEEVEFKESTASVIEETENVEENAWKVHSRKNKMDVYLNCCKCSFKCKERTMLKKHMVKSHPEKQFNCNECDFQATAQLQLNKHMNLKHKALGQNLKQLIQCKNCGEQFSKNGT